MLKIRTHLNKLGLKLKNIKYNLDYKNILKDELINNEG